MPVRGPVVPRSIRNPAPATTQASVELTGIIGLPGGTKALVEITEAGAGLSVKRATVQEGERIGAVDVVHIDAAKGQITIRNAGIESVLKLKTPRLRAAVPSPLPGLPKASFAAPPGNWPPIFGDINGDLEVRIHNPNPFSVRVGLRSGDRGRDFIVGAFGTQGVRASSGQYVAWFQYSTEPGSLHQGDSFSLRDRGVQITITQVAFGNYAIRKVN
jgi:hypothetical protein